VIAFAGTVTGSIGVYFGKPNFRGLLSDKLGMSFDQYCSQLLSLSHFLSLSLSPQRLTSPLSLSVQILDNGHMYSTLHSYTEQEKQKLSHFLDRIYEDFTAKVAIGRRLDPVAVEKVRCVS
jgi:ClpP class serine protease